MDFGLSEDQVMLEETLRGFLADQVPIERVRELRHEPQPNDRVIWQDLAELGVTGVLVPEAQGGAGLALLDAALVAGVLGHAATPTPFLSTGVMAVTALKQVAGAQAEAWLTEIAAGRLVMGVAVTELFSLRENGGTSLDGSRISGKSMMAIDAVDADLLLVAVDDSTLAVIDANAKGVTIERLRTVDETRSTAEIVFEGAGTQAVFSDAGDAVQRMLEAGRIVLAADTLGCCDSMVAQAVAYSKERKQFDRVIGSFQAVKHMCSEMIAEVEPARSLVWYAAHSFDVIPADAPLMACTVLAHVSEIGREIASVSTQVHGGIGWTDEQNLHFWFKRIANARHLLGGPEWLRARAAELKGLVPAV